MPRNGVPYSSSYKEVPIWGHQIWPLLLGPIVACFCCSGTHQQVIESCIYLNRLQSTPGNAGRASLPTTTYKKKHKQTVCALLLLNKKEAASGPIYEAPLGARKRPPRAFFCGAGLGGRTLNPFFLQSSGGWLWAHEQANILKWSMKNSTCCEALGELAAHTSAWPFSLVFWCPQVGPQTCLKFTPSEAFIQASCVAECRYCPAVGPLNCNVDIHETGAGANCKCNTTAKLF